MKNLITKKNGFALLYAVLVASLFLAIGATIASATLKNFVFASSGRDSQFAFYSADSGIECALYWDKLGLDGSGVSIFPTSTSPTAVQATSFTCNDQSVALPRATADASGGVDSQFTIGPSSPPYSIGDVCATVIVTKYASTTAPTEFLTTVVSRGYNTCDTQNPRRLERGLRADY